MPNFLSSRSTPPAGGPGKRPLSVTQLVHALRLRLEDSFGDVHVEGEISGLKVQASGHVYFDLKDAGALISCVLWASGAGRLSFMPAAGMKVECRGQVTVYDKAGRMQLIVASLRRAGEGELWARFQALKARLEAEGLFDSAHKRPLPPLPRRLGVITSPTGAVLRDILQILRRRAPSLPVLLHPARVQGEGAGAELARAVRALGSSGLVDVLIIGRGGGSFEDLFEFNSEELVRALRACPVPVISAVGHETDFTLCDFAADLRAPTPSAAAEIVSTAFASLHDRVAALLRRQTLAVEGQLRDRRRRVEGLLSSYALRLPEQRLREAQQAVDGALGAMELLLERRLERLRRRAERASAGLDGHNPALILAKGYAIVRRTDGRVLPEASGLKRNLRVRIELRDGERQAIITDDAAPDLFE